MEIIFEEFTSSVVYAPVVHMEGTVIVMPILSTAVMYMPWVAGGEVEGRAISMFPKTSEVEFYEPRMLHGTNARPIDLEQIQSSLHLYNPSIMHGEVVGDIISLAAIESNIEFYLPYISQIISLDEFTSSEMYEPTLTDGRLISVDSISGTAILYPPEIRDDLIILDMFTSSEMYDITVTNINPISFDELESGVVLYEPTVEVGGAHISFPVFTSSFVYPITVRGTRAHPLRFKRAESPLGGSVTMDNLAAALDYVPTNSSQYNSVENFVTSRIAGLVTPYIPSVDALFSSIMYRGFYIRNDSQSISRSNIDFWINGGESYQIQTNQVNKIVSEAQFILEAEKELHDAQFTSHDNDDYLYGGKSRTSLFGQMRVSYLIRRNLYPTNEQGVGVGINLNREIFTPGNRVTRIPNLGPGEEVGVYLKLEYSFSPDFPIKNDYSFFHLRYDSNDGSSESYPGQLSGPTDLPLGLMLPSVYLRVGTDYDKLNVHLKREVDTFYNRYPPYFAHYED